MRKKDEQAAINRLNQQIDAVIRGEDIQEKDDTLGLVQQLNALAEAEFDDPNLQGRLLARINKADKQSRPIGFWGELSLRPVLMAACSILLILGVASVLYKTVILNPKASVQIATRDSKVSSPIDNPASVDKIQRQGNAGIQVKPDNRVVMNSKESEPISPLNTEVSAPAEPKAIAKKEKSLSEYSFSYNGDDSKTVRSLSASPSTGTQSMDREFNTESYDRIHENSFKNSVDYPLSTFSIDVDTASYANLRRFINQGQLPPKDAVRVEELINYFPYNYPEPLGDKPFSVTAEMADCPWNSDHKLVRIGLQGKRVDMAKAPANNLVFLLDVSGSMEDPNKLPLLKSSFRLLVEQMRPKDRVAIVVYAGAAGLILPPTSGEEKEKILAALDGLQAGGSTAGGEGIRLAYETARRSFVKNGNNRVILATDGDFNVGASSDAEMERLIEKEREDGIFLSVLGFGMGNYKDSKMEKLADRGNGNYAYIDNLQEARKVLVEEMGGTLLTIAKDVKIQVEFNPARVRSYRQIGYENRALAAEDFEDDKKDAGELGSGHTVTALYEVELNDGKSPKGRDLKYQETAVKHDSLKSKEYLTVKLRYKDPDGDKSKLIEVPLTKGPTSIAAASNDFRFAAAVAAFGMLIRDSEYKGQADLAMVLSLAESGLGKDVGEYRRSFMELVRDYQRLSK